MNGEQLAERASSYAIGVISKLIVGGAIDSKDILETYEHAAREQEAIDLVNVRDMLNGQGYFEWLAAKEGVSPEFIEQQLTQSILGEDGQDQDYGNEG